MSAPVVSVLIATYNGERFVAEAIESVLASSLRDFELIIVDDGSTDRTVEIARRYCADKRVQLHINEKNLGDYPNRNRAASYARGKYLKYVDHDDVIYPHGLEVMVAAMEKYPSAGFGLERPLLPDRPYPVSVEPAEAYHEHFLRGGLFGCGPTAAIIRASSFREVGTFRELRWVGDIDIWLRLGARFPTVKFMPGLVWWRHHENQETHAQTVRGPIASFRVTTEALGQAHCPLSPAQRSEALRRVRWYAARKVLRHALRERRIKYAGELRRGCDLNWGQVCRGFLPLAPKSF